MIGGFMGVRCPHRLIDALVSRGAKHLTVIANDTARPGVASASSFPQALYLERSSHTSAQTLRPAQNVGLVGYRRSASVLSLLWPQ